MLSQSLYKDNLFAFSPFGGTGIPTREECLKKLKMIELAFDALMDDLEVGRIYEYDFVFFEVPNGMGGISARGLSLLQLEENMAAWYQFYEQAVYGEKVNMKPNNHKS